MGFLSVLNFTHKLIADHLTDGDIAIDATVGNGNDTLFLLERVGSTGRVYGFDIQRQALEITLEKLAKQASAHASESLHPVSRSSAPTALDITEEHALGKSHPVAVQFFQQSHAEMHRYIPAGIHGQVTAIMFNLGYCPGQNHHIVTRPDSTISALTASAGLLQKGGIITVVVYTGHEGAQEEAEAVTHWSGQLPPANYNVFKYQYINQINHPSFLIAIEKR